MGSVPCVDRPVPGRLWPRAVRCDVFSSSSAAPVQTQEPHIYPIRSSIWIGIVIALCFLHYKRIDRKSQQQQVLYIFACHLFPQEPKIQQTRQGFCRVHLFLIPFPPNGSSAPGPHAPVHIRWSTTPPAAGSPGPPRRSAPLCGSCSPAAPWPPCPPAAR